MNANIGLTNQSATPDFNRLARMYLWMELLTFGPWLERCRFAFVSDFGACRNALILGDGDGRFTARLLKTNPFIHVDAVDASPAMLFELLRRAGTENARVDIHPADARNFNFPGSQYDLIATHFFLDCLTTDEIASLVRRLRSRIAPEALWVVSEFAVPPNSFGRLVARPLVGCLYRIFGVLTGLTIRGLPDYPAIFLQSGFVPILKRSMLAGLIVSEIWSVNTCLAKQTSNLDGNLLL